MHYGAGAHGLDLKKKKYKYKRVDALWGGWTLIGIATKVQK